MVGHSGRFRRRGAVNVAPSSFHSLIITVGPAARVSFHATTTREPLTSTTPREPVAAVRRATITPPRPNWAATGCCSTSTPA